MKIYMAALETCHIVEYHKLFPDAQINLLIGYGSPASQGLHFMLNKFRDKIGSIMLDAGTYELNNGKKPSGRMALNLEGYKTYLKMFAHLFDHYFNFDEDFSANGMHTNLCNLDELEAAGLSPIPVVHNIYGDEIDLFIDRGYKYVALGSDQITSKKHLAHAMEKFVKADVKVHLFGNSTFDYLANFPIYSCDTARWAYSAMNGFIYFWNHEKEGTDKNEKLFLERFPGIPRGKGVLSLKNDHPFIQMLHDKFGIDALSLIASGDYQYLVNMHHNMEMEAAINEIHRRKGFNTTDTE